MVNRVFGMKYLVGLPMTSLDESIDCSCQFKNITDYLLESLN